VKGLNPFTGLYIANNDMEKTKEGINKLGQSFKEMNVPTDFQSDYSN
jgi:hypothetical protein